MSEPKIDCDQDFYDLTRLMRKLVKWTDHIPNQYHIKQATRVILSGEYPLFDYNVGMYEMDIYLIREEEDSFLVRMYLSTIDDGGSEAITGEITDFEKANRIFEKLKDGLSYEKLSKLPSFDEFEKILYYYGLGLNTSMDS